DEIMLAAAVRGLRDIVKEAIEMEANVNDQHLDRDDLLLTSAENGDIENVTQAITSGANVNVHHPKKDQITALHLVSKGGHYNIVQLLLNFKADPNICDEHGLTPAHHASQKGRVDVLKLLNEVGRVDINAIDNHGKTPAHHASQKGHVDVLKLLIEVGRVDINVTDK
ncbi:serine/threonine-protein kinase TNNI3K-like, partial [Gigantopelta aegis]|uniref:serine/threonine-protein kinase TNNI3K-like n=1 Tax=Gigantopelta aegis TaxID=1735272 RepID=UPI001B88DC87